MSYGVAVHVGCGVMAREYAFWTDGGTCTRHQILLEEAPPLAPVGELPRYRHRDVKVEVMQTVGRYVSPPLRWERWKMLDDDLAAFAAWLKRVRALESEYQAACAAAPGGLISNGTSEEQAWTERYRALCREADAEVTATCAPPPPLPLRRKAGRSATW